MDDYHTANISNTKDWAKKYYALKRNYDTITRICKEKCNKNDELQQEISCLIKKKNKFDELDLKNKQYENENNELIMKNSDLNHSVQQLQKKIDLTEMHFNEMNQTIKNKSKIQMELENHIEKITKSLSISQCQENKIKKENKKLNVSFINLKNKFENLENKNQDLNDFKLKIKSENKNLKTRIIQKDNILLSKDIKIKNLELRCNEKYNEYNKLYKKYKQIELKNNENESICTNYKMDIEILTNRLKHFDKNDDDKENNKNIENKIKNLREIISDLETQNKFNMITIDDLTKIKKEYLNFKQKYDELKRNNILNKDKYKEIESKYDNLQNNFQTKTEQFNKLSMKYDKIDAENNNLKQNINEINVELNQLKKQYNSLNICYDNLQKQYSSYLDKKNTKKINELKEIKILSERQALLKNDFQRLLLENQEWIKKYNDLKKEFDALNKDYINCRNHSLQIESLLNETKIFNQENIKKLQLSNDEKLNELNKEIKLLNNKIIDMENENIMLRNKPSLSISEYTMLCNKEKQLNDIINKMYIADQSCEPSFKCIFCNKLFIDPVTCQPCGHSFCKKCIKSKKDICKECNVKVKYFPNEILENLTNKFKMRLKTFLPALQQIANRRTNVSGV